MKRHKFDNLLRIYEPMLKETIWVVFAEDYDGYRRIAKRRLNLNVSDNRTNSEVTTQALFQAYAYETGRCGIVWLKDLEDADSIPHEMFHAVAWIMRHKDTPLNIDTEEMYCYLLGFFCQKIDDWSKLWKSRAKS